MMIVDCGFVRTVSSPLGAVGVLLVRGLPVSRSFCALAQVTTRLPELYTVCLPLITLDCFHHKMNRLRRCNYTVRKYQTYVCIAISL